MNEELYKYNVRDILGISTNPLIGVQVTRDSYPNGLSVAMSPMLVNWKVSSPGFDAQSCYLVKNVNLGSNPVAGEAVLGTVRIPVGGIDRVEWVFVVSKVGGRDSQAGHAMIRFLFRDDNRPCIVTDEGEALGYHLDIQDLIFSWEAWRPPLADFDPLAGLDPEKYALSMRCYSGPVRCISDTVLNRPWICYPLNLPDVPDAAGELLYVCMVMGDAVARHTIGIMFDERIENALNTPEGYEGEDLSIWEGIRDSLRTDEVPGNPIEEMLEGRTRYHLIERSCVTMALIMLDVANVRIHRRGGLEEPPRINAVPEKLPPLIHNLEKGNLRTALFSIPSAIHWLIHNQTVIPGKAHELLDEVGLLQRKNGKIVSESFDNTDVTPYGRIDEHMIY